MACLCEIMIFFTVLLNCQLNVYSSQCLDNQFCVVMGVQEQHRLGTWGTRLSYESLEMNINN